MLRLTRRELETGLWGTAPVLDPTDERRLETELRATAPVVDSTELEAFIGKAFKGLAIF